MDLSVPLFRHPQQRDVQQDDPFNPTKKRKGDPTNVDHPLFFFFVMHSFITCYLHFISLFNNNNNIILVLLLFDFIRNRKENIKIVSWIKIVFFSKNIIIKFLLLLFFFHQRVTIFLLTVSSGCDQ